jgi:hypothetical protein
VNYTSQPHNQLHPRHAITRQIPLCRSQYNRGYNIAIHRLSKKAYALKSYSEILIPLSHSGDNQSCNGRSIAQAVNHGLPTAVAQVRFQVWTCGICSGRSGPRAGFLRVLRFTLPLIIPPNAPYSHPGLVQ